MKYIMPFIIACTFITPLYMHGKKTRRINPTRDATHGVQIAVNGAPARPAAQSNNKPFLSLLSTNTLEAIDNAIKQSDSARLSANRAAQYAANPHKNAQLSPARHAAIAAEEGDRHTAHATAAQQPTTTPIDAWRETPAPQRRWYCCYCR